jgi:acetoacetyl-CoA synthetase
METGTIVWQPSAERIEASNYTAFLRAAEKRTGKSFSGYEDLHAWSVEDTGGFWDIVWDFCGVIGDKGARKTTGGLEMPGTRFFPDARMSFAENLLRASGVGEAMIFRGEDKVERRVTYDDLHALVSKFRQFLQELGVESGDRIAAMMPNMPETIIGMLAANSLGAVWSSCSPDFGENGVLDRFGQIEPKVLIACDGYWYNGKKIEVAEKLAAVSDRLTTVAKVVVVDYLGQSDEVASGIPKAVTFASAIHGRPAAPVEFLRLPFDHPLYILFSSGTTGVPKCIVHGQGGTLLQHLKEQNILLNIGKGSRFFYFTTCGWMMWNWLASGLACEATLMLYDGSPFYPDARALWKFAEDERFTFFGTSAKYIDAVRNSGLRPKDEFDLSAIETITSTGSPLAPENFRFVYDAIKADVHLASISGGTDIVSCFVGGVPTYPVRIGEIQGAGLGMAVEVWDDEGRAVTGQKGELVCVRPFASMPIGFWNDPDGAKYHDAYFDRFEGVWCHGDFAEWTENGGMVIHGRSDATLNPGGVRIGTAEIYNQVEQMAEIEEAICIGQDWEGDTRVVLFVRLAPGAELDEDLAKRIRTRIRTGASPRHVPAKIIPVADIPRTKSGKITELAVRDVVHGRPVKNKEALANPEALDLYVDIEELKS